MYLFEYKNVEFCVIICKITAVAKNSTTVAITFDNREAVDMFDFDTQEEADNVYIELIQAIQDFYAK